MRKKNKEGEDVKRLREGVGFVITSEGLDAQKKSNDGGALGGDVAKLSPTLSSTRTPVSIKTTAWIAPVKANEVSVESEARLWGRRGWRK